MSAEREIGMHAKAIETLESDMSEVKRDLAEIKSLLAGARGGWKVLVAVAGLAATAGAALSKFLELIGRVAASS